jgi:choline dehydrogenase-like flavoprotein
MSKPEHADVLVIGAGASGAIQSLVLAQAGLSVVCLDQGGWTEPGQHPHHSQDFQYQRENGWNPDPVVRKRSDDYPVEGEQSHAQMWNGVGGAPISSRRFGPGYDLRISARGLSMDPLPTGPSRMRTLLPFTMKRTG